MPDWKLENLWDPKNRFSGDSSPFIVGEGQLCEFRPWKAIQFLQERRNSTDERWIILAGLTTWMVAPTGMIKTVTPNMPKLSPQKFIHQAMIIRAAEVLEEAFYSARRYQIRSGDPSTETLLSQPLLLEASFDIFFALGGFEALLETISVEEFQKALQNQSVPVNHLFEVVSMVLARDEAAPDTVLERTDIERRVAFTIKGEDILAGKDDKVAGTRRGPNTIRDHWDRLRISSPLIYAAKPLGDGDFMRQVLRDPSLQPWEHRIPFEVRHVWDDRRFDYGFRWVEPWLKRADEVATVLRKHKFLESWPPKDAVFPLDT